MSSPSSALASSPPTRLYGVPVGCYLEISPSGRSSVNLAKVASCAIEQEGLNTATQSPVYSPPSRITGAVELINNNMHPVFVVATTSGISMLTMVTSQTVVMAPNDEASFEALPAARQMVIEELRNNSREVVADSLQDLLQNMAQEYSAKSICVISLRAMAELLVEEQCLADPTVSPDDAGIMYAQWPMDSGGHVVLGFPEQDQILLAAHRRRQVDMPAFNKRAQGSRPDILEEFGYLIPRRETSERTTTARGS